MTLREVCELYLCSRVVSSQYAAQLIRTAKAFELVNPGVRTGQISAEHIGRFVAEIRRRTGNLNTLGNYVTQLRILVCYAQRCGLLAQVPPIPRVPKVARVPRAWTLEEFKRLYDVANQLPGRVGVQLARIWWPSLIATAYHTASRIGALLSTTWSDIDCARGLIVIRAESQKTKREQVFQLPEYVLKKILAMQWPERKLIWEWPHCRRYFFTKFRQILRHAQLEPPADARFSLFHKIRRTAASIAAMRSGIPAAQTLLGHASAKVTIQHYIDPYAAGFSVTLPSLE